MPGEEAVELIAHIYQKNKKRLQESVANLEKNGAEPVQRCHLSL